MLEIVCADGDSRESHRKSVCTCWHAPKACPHVSHEGPKIKNVSPCNPLGTDAGFSVDYGAISLADDILIIFKFLCECMDVMLGADSDDQNQTSY